MGGGSRAAGRDVAAHRYTKHAEAQHGSDSGNTLQLLHDSQRVGFRAPWRRRWRGAPLGATRNRRTLRRLSPRFRRRIRYLQVSIHVSLQSGIVAHPFAGRSPSVIVRVSWLVPRTTVTVAGVFGDRLRIAPARSSLLATAWPSTAVMTSPTFSPACCAGLCPAVSWPKPVTSTPLETERFPAAAICGVTSSP